jgi:hypothetical protein
VGKLISEELMKRKMSLKAILRQAQQDKEGEASEIAISLNMKTASMGF